MLTHKSQQAGCLYSDSSTLGDGGGGEKPAYVHGGKKTTEKQNRKEYLLAHHWNKIKVLASGTGTYAVFKEPPKPGEGT